MGAAYVFVRHGTTWTPQAMLTASDGTANDSFGFSVALSGATAMIGAIGKSGGYGAVYVFVHQGKRWSQQAELTAPCPCGSYDNFGNVVALSGDTALVGARGKTTSANPRSGAAYVFVRHGTTWTRQATLTDPTGAADDNFGNSVALSGDIALIGAPSSGSKGAYAGAAYTFVRHGTTWTQQVELTASDVAPGDHFGYAVALSGGTALVGAPAKNSSAGVYTGATYVFGRRGTRWTQQAELAANDGAANDSFGQSVALSGTSTLVGAPGNNRNIGAAYVFARSGSAWTQQAKLSSSDGARGDFFSYSVALSGDTVLVGGPSSNRNIGAVYVFGRSGTAWAQQAEPSASDGAASDQFGASVAVSGTTALIGAPSNNRNFGAAYVFVRRGITWMQQAKLMASDGAANDIFGYSVALSGDIALIGANGKNNGSGAAYVFVRSGTGWTQQAELTASDGAANDRFGRSVTLSGDTALVGAWSKNGTTGAAYVFVSRGATWMQQAKLTASDGAANDHFGVSVALSGDTALIGANGKNNGTGAAYVFVRRGATWTQQATLTAGDGAAGNNCGVSVALSGDTALVGAPAKNNGTGAAYMFVRRGTTWTQQAQLSASDGAAKDYFGVAVAISEATVLVGAPARNNVTGAVYVFGRSGAAWTPQDELTASDARPGDEYGNSVNLSGSSALVGAPHENGVPGAAYVLVRRGTMGAPGDAQTD